ncbi:hypothetical protein [Rheinheimera sp.]|uniref:hypothetical protein n=1 Tax=Rheinheimera sp. TaxID=1869214 RepID=UPI002FDD8C10
MQFDQIPQSLCNPLPVFSAIFYPAVALLYPCFFASKQFGPISGQTRLWQLWSDKTSAPAHCTAVAGTPYFAVSEPEQPVSERAQFIIHADTNTQFQNFNGNTIFAFGVATAVFQSGSCLQPMRTLLFRSWPHLTYQNFAAVPVLHKWQLTISAPKQGAATAVAGNCNAAKGRFIKPDKFRVKGEFNITKRNAAARGCQKLQLYQVDNINLLIPDDWLAESQGASCRAQSKRLFYASFGGLTLSFRPYLWQYLHRALTYLHGGSGFSAECNSYAARAQSWAMTTHLRLSQFSEQLLQRQVTAVAAAWRRPIFAAIRHQVAALRALHRLQILNTGLQQQKIPVTQKYFLEASHCFDLKKFRLFGRSEIILKFLKKIPKVIQNAADSLNKGNCNCSDLVLKVSLLQ